MNNRSNKLKKLLLSATSALTILSSGASGAWGLVPANVLDGNQLDFDIDTGVVNTNLWNGGRNLLKARYTNGIQYTGGVERWTITPGAGGTFQLELALGDVAGGAGTSILKLIDSTIGNALNTTVITKSTNGDAAGIIGLNISANAARTYDEFHIPADQNENVNVTIGHLWTVKDFKKLNPANRALTVTTVQNNGVQFGVDSTIGDVGSMSSYKIDNTNAVGVLTFTGKTDVAFSHADALKVSMPNADTHAVTIGALFVDPVGGPTATLLLDDVISRSGITDAANAIRDAAAIDNDPGALDAQKASVKLVYQAMPDVVKHLHPEYKTGGGARPIDNTGGLQVAWDAEKATYDARVTLIDSIIDASLHTDLAADDDVTVAFAKALVDAGLSDKQAMVIAAAARLRADGQTYYAGNAATSVAGINAIASAVRKLQIPTWFSFAAGGDQTLTINGDDATIKAKSVEIGVRILSANETELAFTTHDEMGPKTILNLTADAIGGTVNIDSIGAGNNGELAGLRLFGDNAFTIHQNVGAGNTMRIGFLEKTGTAQVTVTPTGAGEVWNLPLSFKSAADDANVLVQDESVDDANELVNRFTIAGSAAATNLLIDGATNEDFYGATGLQFSMDLAQEHTVGVGTVFASYDNDASNTFKDVIMRLGFGSAIANKMRNAVYADPTGIAPVLAQGDVGEQKDYVKAAIDAFGFADAKRDRLKDVISNFLVQDVADANIATTLARNLKDAGATPEEAIAIATAARAVSVGSNVVGSGTAVAAAANTIAEAIRAAKIPAWLRFNNGGNGTLNYDAPNANVSAARVDLSVYLNNNTTILAVATPDETGPRTYLNIDSANDNGILRALVLAGNGVKGIRVGNSNKNSRMNIQPAGLFPVNEFIKRSPTANTFTVGTVAANDGLSMLPLDASSVTVDDAPATTFSLMRGDAAGTFIFSGQTPADSAKGMGGGTFDFGSPDALKLAGTVFDGVGLTNLTFDSAATAGADAGKSFHAAAKFLGHSDKVDLLVKALGVNGMIVAAGNEAAQVTAAKAVYKVLTGVDAAGGVADVINQLGTGGAAADVDDEAKTTAFAAALGSAGVAPDVAALVAASARTVAAGGATDGGAEAEVTGAVNAHLLGNRKLVLPVWLNPAAASTLTLVGVDNDVKAKSIEIGIGLTNGAAVTIAQGSSAEAKARALFRLRHLSAGATSSFVLGDAATASTWGGVIIDGGSAAGAGGFATAITVGNTLKTLKSYTNLSSGANSNLQITVTAADGGISIPVYDKYGDEVVGASVALTRGGGHNITISGNRFDVDAALLAGLKGFNSANDVKGNNDTAPTTLNELVAKIRLTPAIDNNTVKDADAQSYRNALAAIVSVAGSADFGAANTALGGGGFTGVGVAENAELKAAWVDAVGYDTKAKIKALANYMNGLVRDPANGTDLVVVPNDKDNGFKWLQAALGAGNSTGFTSAGNSETKITPSWNADSDAPVLDITGVIKVAADQVIRVQNFGNAGGAANAGANIPAVIVHATAASGETARLYLDAADNPGANEPRVIWNLQGTGNPVQISNFISEDGATSGDYSYGGAHISGAAGIVTYTMTSTNNNRWVQFNDFVKDTNERFDVIAGRGSKNRAAYFGLNKASDASKRVGHNARFGVKFTSTDATQKIMVTGKSSESLDSADSLFFRVADANGTLIAAKDAILDMDSLFANINANATPASYDAIARALNSNVGETLVQSFKVLGYSPFKARAAETALQNRMNALVGVGAVDAAAVKAAVDVFVDHLVDASKAGGIKDAAAENLVSSLRNVADGAVLVPETKALAKALVTVGATPEEAIAIVAAAVSRTNNAAAAPTGAMIKAAAEAAASEVSEYIMPGWMGNLVDGRTLTINAADNIFAAKSVEVPFYMDTTAAAVTNTIGFDFPAGAAKTILNVQADPTNLGTITLGNNSSTLRGFKMHKDSGPLAINTSANTVHIFNIFEKNSNAALTIAAVGANSGVVLPAYKHNVAYGTSAALAGVSYSITRTDAGNINVTGERKDATNAANSVNTLKLISSGTNSADDDIRVGARLKMAEVIGAHNGFATTADGQQAVIVFAEKFGVGANANEAAERAVIIQGLRTEEDEQLAVGDLDKVKSVTYSFRNVATAPANLIVRDYQILANAEKQNSNISSSKFYNFVYSTDVHTHVDDFFEIHSTGYNGTGYTSFGDARAFTRNGNKDTFAAAIGDFVKLNASSDAANTTFELSREFNFGGADIRFGTVNNGVGNIAHWKGELTTTEEAVYDLGGNADENYHKFDKLVLGADKKFFLVNSDATAAAGIIATVSGGYLKTVDAVAAPVKLNMGFELVGAGQKLTLTADEMTSDDYSASVDLTANRVYSQRLFKADNIVLGVSKAVDHDHTATFKVDVAQELEILHKNVRVANTSLAKKVKYDGLVADQGAKLGFSRPVVTTHNYVSKNVTFTRSANPATDTTFVHVTSSADLDSKATLVGADVKFERFSTFKSIESAVVSAKNLTRATVVKTLDLKDLKVLFDANSTIDTLIANTITYSDSATVTFKDDTLVSQKHAFTAGVATLAKSASNFTANIGEFTGAAGEEVIINSNGAWKGSVVTSGVTIGAATDVIFTDFTAAAGLTLKAGVTTTISGTSSMPVALAGQNGLTISGNYTGSLTSGANTSVVTLLDGTTANVSAAALDVKTLAVGDATVVLGGAVTKVDFATTSGKTLELTPGAKLDKTQTSFSGVGNVKVNMNNQTIESDLGILATHLGTVTLLGTGVIDSNIYAGSLTGDNTSILTFNGASGRVAEFSGDFAESSNHAQRLTFHALAKDDGVKFGKAGSAGIVYAENLVFTGAADTVHEMLVGGIKGAGASIAADNIVKFGSGSSEFKLNQALTGAGTAQFVDKTKVVSTIDNADIHLAFDKEAIFEGGNVTKAKDAKFAGGLTLKTAATVNDISSVVGVVNLGTAVLNTDSAAAVIAASATNAIKFGDNAKIDHSGAPLTVSQLQAGRKLNFSDAAPATEAIVILTNLASDVKEEHVKGFRDEGTTMNIYEFSVHEGNLVRIGKPAAEVMKEIEKNTEAASEDAIPETKIEGSPENIVMHALEVAIKRAMDKPMESRDLTKGFDYLIKEFLGHKTILPDSATEEEKVQAKIASEVMVNFQKETRERPDDAISKIGSSVVGVDFSMIAGAMASAISLTENATNVRFAQVAGAASGDVALKTGFWVLGSVGKGSLEKEGIKKGFKSSSWSMTGGADFEPVEGQVIGASVTYASSLVKPEGVEDQTKAFKPLVISAYSNNSLGGNIFFRFIGMMASLSNESKDRTIDPSAELVTAIYNSKYVSVNGMLGANLAMAENAYIVPVAGLEYRYSNAYQIAQTFVKDKAIADKSFSSKGGLIGKAGVSMCYVAAGDGYKFIPEASVMVNYDLNPNAQDMEVTMYGTPDIWKVSGASTKAEALYFDGSLGGTMKYDMFEVSLKGNAMKRGKYLGYGGSLKLRVNL
jgi:hypothetical protein